MFTLGIIEKRSSVHVIVLRVSNRAVVAPDIMRNRPRGQPEQGVEEVPSPIREHRTPPSCRKRGVRIVRVLHDLRENGVKLGFSVLFIIT